MPGKDLYRQGRKAVKEHLLVRKLRVRLVATRNLYNDLDYRVLYENTILVQSDVSGQQKTGKFKSS